MPIDISEVDFIMLITKYDIYGVDSALRFLHKHANKFDISDYLDLDSLFLSQFTDYLMLAGYSKALQSLRSCRLLSKLFVGIS